MDVKNVTSSDSEQMKNSFPACDLLKKETSRAVLYQTKYEKLEVISKEIAWVLPGFLPGAFFPCKPFILKL